ncbi:MAG: DUF922 domain-containing protein [Gemmatimonadaceae bacterium]|nr:DUF922 domain-containing protein [Chitinophagaceae bacterium]
MNWKILTIILLTIGGLSFTGKEESSLPWKATRKLNWNDFKGKVPEGSTVAALTSARINFKYGYSIRQGLNYEISCFFEKNSSWGRVKNDHILSHEQGHFDITEIHARKLHRDLKKYKFNHATASKDINAIYQNIVNQQNDMQNEYDDESNFSRDKARQAEWLKKIQDELESLKEFAGY